MTAKTNKKDIELSWVKFCSAISLGGGNNRVEAVAGDDKTQLSLEILDGEQWLVITSGEFPAPVHVPTTNISSMSIKS